MTDSHPLRRASDERWHVRLRRHLVRENWYRDVGLLAIAGVMVVVAGTAKDASSTASSNARQAKRLAEQTAKVAAQNRELSLTIQRQRADNLRRQCEGQNERHDATVRALDRLLKHPRPVPELPGVSREVRLALVELQAAQAHGTRAGTVFLIDALAPRQDCERVVRLALHPPPLPAVPPLPPLLRNGIVPARR